MEKSQPPHSQQELYTGDKSAAGRHSQNSGMNQEGDKRKHVQVIKSSLVVHVPDANDAAEGNTGENFGNMVNDPVSPAAIAEQAMSTPSPVKMRN